MTKLKWRKVPVFHLNLSNVINTPINAAFFHGMALSGSVLIATVATDFKKATSLFKLLKKNGLMPMLHYLRGRLIEKSPVHAVVDVGGVAYYMQISLNTFGKLPSSEEVKLYTHFSINSNDFSLNLFGFADENEREVFRKLISVSGIGPNTARMVLSGSSTEEVKQMILMRDVAGFKRIKGIGEKTAERIIVDLHDKIAKTADGSFEKISFSHNNHKQEALAALTSLGLEKTKTEKIVDKIALQQPGITLEDLIKQVLKQL